MRRCGLLGERLSYSYSPQIHAMLGDYEYRLYEKQPNQLEDFLKNGDFHGLNVTIPYKKAVMEFCGEVSETARAIGSVNTLTRRPDGLLYGDNTDFFGFSYLLEKSGVDITSGKTIILGSGGSSLTAQAVLKKMGAREIVIVSRSGTNNYENINNHSDAEIIINATPVGTYPNNGISPIADPGIFKKCRAVIDLIYNPAKTELLLQAEERKITAVNGLAMLAAQAKKSAEIFTGESIADEVTEEIIKKITLFTQNIVLIGMPGCGKTSIGSALAKRINRKFADTDMAVVEAAGKTVGDIFAQDGECAFRNLETKALEQICKQSGMVVATGGGVVTRPENLRLIRQNGIIVYLDRDISRLPVSDRPLSMQKGIDALAEARLPLYRQWAEHTAEVCGVLQTAENIYEMIFGSVK